MVSETVIEEYLRAEVARKRRIAKAWLAYQGDLDPPLKPIASDPEARDNVRINIASVIVETTVSALWRPNTTVTLDDQDADDWLSQFLAHNHFDAVMHSAATNGAVAGQVFVRLEPGSTFPRVVVLDSAAVTMLAERDDYTDVFAFLIEWKGVDARNGKPFVRRQIHERNDQRTAWQIRDYIQYSDGRTSTFLGMPVFSPKWELISDVIHPYPWSQIHTCQNLPMPNVQWGQPDLDDDVVNLNQALNANRSYAQRITRMFAHPRVVAKGFNAEKLTASAGDTIHIPADGDLAYLEMKSQLEGITEHYMRLMEAIHAVTRTPSIATGRTENLGALSGVALKILYSPLLQKTETKRSLYGHLLQDLFRHALEMEGITYDGPISIEWPSPVPVDEREQMEVMLQKAELGVSKTTLIEELGYDVEQENERLMEQRAEEETIGQRLLQAFERGRDGAAWPGSTK